MKPFRIRVNRLIDFGAIVTLIGVDADASKPVTVHVDYWPFDVVWAAWRDIGSKQPIEYAADGLTLSLRVAGDDHIEGALVGWGPDPQAGKSKPVPRGAADRRPRRLEPERHRSRNCRSLHRSAPRRRIDGDRHRRTVDGHTARLGMQSR
jgi:hypothetical protein